MNLAPNAPEPRRDSDPRLGLCPVCAHVLRIESAKGSTFLLCARAKLDPRFTKYPPQPLFACAGFERAKVR